MGIINKVRRAVLDFRIAGAKEDMVVSVLNQPKDFPLKAETLMKKAANLKNLRQRRRAIA